jgi:hypothetical protein
LSLLFVAPEFDSGAAIMTFPNSYQPRKKTAERYGVHVRSIDRWEQNPSMDFPKPLVVNGRKYDNLHELETWERMRVTNIRSHGGHSAIIDKNARKVGHSC